MASQRGRSMSGILGRRRVAALAPPWEAASVGNARDKPEAARLQAHIDSLEALVADQERQMARLENELKDKIPVGEMHAQLDRCNLPRRSPNGAPYVISERFAILRARLESEVR
jgi:hypothetical protein